MTANPTKTLHMVYDQEGNLIFEADAATGEMLREYIWLQGRPVAVIDAAADSSIYAVHVDHLDRPVMMTDWSGAIVWRADFLPFGEVRTSSGPASLAYRFPGQWFMLETGLHYNWHRWYDASLGRYTQPDPLGMPGGPNRYAYALNSPLMLGDMDGRNPIVLVVTLFPEVGPFLWGVAGAVAGAIIGNEIFNENADEAEGEICPVTPPADPTQPPGEGWEWRGKGEPGSNEGAWHNPETGESLHPDLSHRPPIGPHWDYDRPGGGRGWRVPPGGGRMMPK